MSGSVRAPGSGTGLPREMPKACTDPQLLSADAPVLVLLSGLVAACSGDDSTTRQGLEAVPGEIVGLWDLSAGGDEAFMKITTDARVIYWQMFDGAGEAASNCYRVDTFPLRPLGGDEYLLQQESERPVEPTTIVQDGSELVFRFVDTLDDDDDGDVEEIVEERFRRAEGLSSIDFNVCPSSARPGRA